VYFFQRQLIAGLTMMGKDDGGLEPDDRAATADASVCGRPGLLSVPERREYITGQVELLARVSVADLAARSVATLHPPGPPSSRSRAAAPGARRRRTPHGSTAGRLRDP
jgi:hypothetical protein